MIEQLARPQAPWALRLVPPFPAVAQRILAMVNDPDANINKLSELVKVDPSFAAELLRFANSALLGARRKVRSLPLAIVVVGLDRVKTMATLVSVNRMVRHSVRKEALRKVWVHSLVTALIADEISRVSGIDRESAYTAGAAAQPGHLGLDVGLSRRVLPHARSLHRLRVRSAAYGTGSFRDRSLPGGRYLAQDWDFPDELAAAIAVHHDEPFSRISDLDGLVQVSWRLADTLGYAAFSPKKDWSWEELMEFVPNSTAAWFGASPEAAKAEIDERLAGVPQ